MIAEQELLLDGNEPLIDEPGLPVDENELLLAGKKLLLADGEALPTERRTLLDEARPLDREHELLPLDLRPVCGALPGDCDEDSPYSGGFASVLDEHALLFAHNAALHPEGALLLGANDRLRAEHDWVLDGCPPIDPADRSMSAAHAYVSAES